MRLLNYLHLTNRRSSQNVKMAERLAQFGVGSEVMDAAAVESRWKVSRVLLLFLIFLVSAFDEQF